MEDLRDLFVSMRDTDHYQRIGTPHPLPWYAGVDSQFRKSLFCITETEPSNISSSKFISVFVGKRKDDRYGITFSLMEDKYLDMFAHFCIDIIDYSREVVSLNKAADMICSRYLQWQRLFKKNNGDTLSYESIKGLIGELLFLKKKITPKYGITRSLEAWSGIEQTDQDFTIDDSWFEVKTTTSGSDSIKISSVEQLDSTINGHLVVIILDKTSEGDASRITLNSIYQIVLEDIPTEIEKAKFKSRLLAYGYYFNKEYDKIGFRYNGMEMYRVDSTFPCLRKQLIPSSVNGIKYELSLPAIENYKERRDEC